MASDHAALILTLCLVVCRALHEFTCLLMSNPLLFTDAATSASRSWGTVTNTWPAMPRPSQLGRRGPARDGGSAIKMPCGYRRCKSKADVKNVRKSLRLPPDATDLTQCRRVRADCGIIRFCCAAHLEKCRKAVPCKPRTRQGREAMETDQVALLFKVLLSDGCAWAAALMLLQLFCGERADCMRQCQWGWFRDLSPTASGAPKVQVPKVNGKTVEREVPLHKALAHMLWRWMWEQPLLAAGEGHQWPLPGQEHTSNAFLFPGLDGRGTKHRQWDKPISERAYLARLRRAAAILTENRATARKNNEEHPFEDFDLNKLGTHSMKKTAVTLLKAAGQSTAIVTAITGTSGR
eukprot:7643830-Heterocapsa_arctica.AAC.1